PVAPAFTASRTSSRSSEADSTNTREDGETTSTSVVACTPVPSASCISINTTSGLTTAARRRAAATPSAVATTLNPSSARSRATASRQIGWSSTTITVGKVSSPMTHPLGTPARHAQLPLGSFAHLGVQYCVAAQRCHPSHNRLRDAHASLTYRFLEPA